MSEVINFGQVDPAKSRSFLEPGMYRLKIDTDNVNLVSVPGKNPYLSVKYVSEDGASLTEKFYLTEKSLGRLQYYYLALTGKKLDKAFTSYIEIGQYFESLLKAKAITKPMITGGKETTDGKFYSGLPYTDFVVTDESLFEEGPFDKDSPQYKQVVTVEKPNPAVKGTNAPVLPGYVPVTDASGKSPWDD